MSRLGEFVLRRLVALRRRGGDGGGTAAATTFDDYHRWQFESSAELFAKYPGFDPRGKSILDIGCGIGGRTAWLASQGATRVVGLDINAAEIAIARELQQRLFPALAPLLSYHVSQEDALLDLGEFDYVLLVDMMEHVVSPPAMLRLAHRYTRQGGTCFFSTFGWLSHRGSHMGMLPWLNVFFSDETILNVQRWVVSRPGYHPTRFDSDPPIERWRGIYDLRDRPGEHLNKLTLADVRKLLRHNIFGPGHLELWPISNRLGWFFRLLIRLPLLDELFHSLFVVRLDKTEAKTDDRGAVAGRKARAEAAGAESSAPPPAR
jgi:2-polyprenyl-3-methyl-5-hydroxy-6-metoxy-1,4-benzoquinol methylase